MKETFVIVVLNGGGYEIDRQTIKASDASEAMLIYIKEYKPSLECDDTIKILSE